MPPGNNDQTANREDLPAGVIEFWFDFGSSYAYFAAMEIDALAGRCGRQVAWRPFLLGTAFRQTGAQGLSSTPLKKDYAARDWARLARAHGIAFSPPPGHPAIALAATRAYYRLEEENPRRAQAFAHEVFRRVYQMGDLDTSDAEQVADLGAAFGIDRGDLRSALDDPSLKAPGQGDIGKRRGARDLWIPLLHCRWRALLGRGPHGDDGSLDRDRRLVARPRGILTADPVDAETSTLAIFTKSG